jgi:hypothetical protein
VAQRHPDDGINDEFIAHPIAQNATDSAAT